MGRTVAVVVVAVVLAVLGLGRPVPGTGSQDVATPGTTHPIVGSWILDTDAADPASPLALATFHADGTYFQAEPGISVGVGAWRPTGDRTAEFTVVLRSTGEGGAFADPLKIRASADVDGTGDTFAATFTLEFLFADATGRSELGPGAATGTRIGVEPMGTPVAALESSGTFAGTPAS